VGRLDLRAQTAVNLAATKRLREFGPAKVIRVAADLIGQSRAAFRQRSGAQDAV
jgi:hypothetical protein